MKHLNWNILFVALLLSCSKSDEGAAPMQQPGNTNKIVDGWSVPLQNVQDAGIGKDGIPSLEKPPYIKVSEVSFLTDDELVIGLKMDGRLIAYPHRIMDLHEVANDEINNSAITISLCPLTGSAIGMQSMVDGTPTTFGVSGFLYNSNLIVYDRITDSRWGQMLLASINGSRICDQFSTFNLVETSWANWKKAYPDSEVLDVNTGFGSRYANLPLSSLVSPNNGTSFPVNPVDNRLPNYERVHGVIVGDNVIIYQFGRFKNGTGMISEFFNGKRLLVIGDATRNFIVSFEIPTVLSGLVFEVVEGTSEVILQDDEGNKWDLFGYAVSGPRLGDRLPATRSFIAYWFAWSSIYPDPTISLESND